MKRVYLHIGRSKTGSTAIQRALSTSREELTRRGFLYPGRGLDHVCIVHALRDGDSPHAEEAQYIRAAVRDAPQDVILSAEGLMLIEPERVRAWLDGLFVRVIVYIREQAEASASAYQQEVKANLLSCSFEEYALPRHVDYERFLDRWSDVFGLENMSVRVYEQDAFAGGDLVADFLSALGITDATAFTADKSDPNPSIAGALLEAKRRINACFPGTAEELRAATYPRLLALANSRPDYRGRMHVSNATVDELRSRYEPTNAVVARKYLGRSFAFSPKPWPAVTPFGEDDVADATAAIDAVPYVQG